jgi:hypothetical protein
VWYTGCVAHTRQMECLVDRRSGKCASKVGKPEGKRYDRAYNEMNLNALL